MALGAMLTVLLVMGGFRLATRRRASSEANSVEGYRHTLSTLQNIRRRTGQEYVRPAEREGAVHGAEEVGDAPPSRRRPSRGMVFDDASLGATRPPPEVRLSPRGQHRAMAAMNHGPRRVVGPVLVTLILLALLAAVAEVGLHATHPKSGGSQTAHHGSGGHAGATATRTGQTTATTTHTAVTQAKGGQGASTATTARHSTATTVRHHTRKSTPTTAPTSYTPSGATASSANYTVPPSSYSLSLTSTNGPCWVEVRDASGATVFTQTMAPGSSHTVAATGALQVVVGAPSVISVGVDGRPVVLPSTYQAPFTLNLQPSSG